MVEMFGGRGETRRRTVPQIGDLVFVDPRTGNCFLSRDHVRLEHDDAAIPRLRPDMRATWTERDSLWVVAVVAWSLGYHGQVCVSGFIDTGAHHVFQIQAPAQAHAASSLNEHA